MPPLRAVLLAVLTVSAVTTTTAAAAQDPTPEPPPPTIEVEPTLVVPTPVPTLPPITPTVVVPPPVEEEPPTVAELCALADLDAINAALAGVARANLAGDLAGLHELTVDAELVELKADVDVADVHSALGCDPALPTTTASPPPAVFFPDCAAARRADAAPLLKGEPGYRPELDADKDGIGCEPVEGDDTRQVGRVPVGAPETGGM